MEDDLDWIRKVRNEHYELSLTMPSDEWHYMIHKSARKVIEEFGLKKNMTNVEEYEESVREWEKWKQKKENTMLSEYLSLKTELAGDFFHHIYGEVDQADYYELMKNLELVLFDGEEKERALKMLELLKKIVATTESMVTDSVLVE